MAETATDRPPVFVVKHRGGIADNVFRLALGRVPVGVVINREADGAVQNYRYAGPEEQVEHSNVYDKGAGRNGRVSKVAAVYHIFLPEAECHPGTEAGK